MKNTLAGFIALSDQIQSESTEAMYPLHQPHLAYLKMSCELCDYGTQQYNAGAGNASPYSSM